MNPEYIAKAICFHGKPMQKIWEDERGADDLKNWGVSNDLNYSIYNERQKYFTFQNRAKRLKLHQFLARKSKDLYDSELKPQQCKCMPEQSEKNAIVAVLPPYELLLSSKSSKQERLHYTLAGIKSGDIIYGSVLKPASGISTASILIKPLCTAEPLIRYLGDLPIKAYIHINNIGSMSMEKRSKIRSYALHDYVCCVVLEVSVDADRILLSFENSTNPDIKLGLITYEDLPLYYKKTLNGDPKPYENYLETSKELLNPNLDTLFEINGLDPRDNFTFMTSLKKPFPTYEYAKEIRQIQASKWAFRSVADGIELFKKGLHVEGFQCLNKALQIDPHNIEGLVARGALYANKGSFQKAVEDFEKALKLDAYHVNARKYICETLVALGRTYEEKGLLHQAAKAYRDCLNIVPNHEQALSLLDNILSMINAPNMMPSLVSTVGITGVPPPMDNNMMMGMMMNSNATLSSGSGSSSSHTTTTNTSTQSSFTDNDSENTIDSQGRRQNSLSPLSRRMAIHDATLRGINSGSGGSFINSDEPNALAQLDEDDTESRVQKLLKEASKYKKEKGRKSQPNKSADQMNDINDHTDINSGRNHGNGYNYYSVNSNGYCDKNSCDGAPSILPSTNQCDDYAIASTSSSVGLGLPNVISYNLGKTDSSIRLTSTSVGSARQSEQVPSIVAAPPTKLSFHLKKPVKMDKFGVLRAAAPFDVHKESPFSKSLSKSRSRTRSQSRSPPTKQSRSPRKQRGRISPTARRRNSRRRSSSSEHNRRHRSRSKRRSYTRSRSRSRSRSVRRRPYGRGRAYVSFGGRRRTPSPFLQRDDVMSRRRRRSKSLNISGKRRRSRSRSPFRGGREKYRNRYWQRSSFPSPPPTSSKDNKLRSPKSGTKDKKNRSQYDDPSIEEIDELINKAQKERKEEILKRDKDILKKPMA